jgi:hypothetical protein
VNNKPGFGELFTGAKADVLGIIIELYGKGKDTDSIMGIISFDKKELEQIQGIVQGKLVGTNKGELNNYDIGEKAPNEADGSYEKE